MTLITCGFSRRLKITKRKLKNKFSFESETVSFLNFELIGILSGMLRHISFLNIDIDPFVSIFSYSILYKQVHTDILLSVQVCSSIRLVQVSSNAFIWLQEIQTFCINTSP